MSFLPYIKTDGGREVEGFTWEALDCTVRALAVAFGLKYKEAHAIMKDHGRADSSKARGFSIVVDKKFAAFIEWKKQRSELKMTVGRFLKEHQIGTYILSINGHVFTVINGMIHDSGAVRKGSHVKIAWKCVEKKLLKFEGKFKEGDYIRAYDFKPIRGREDSYIEGTVVEVLTDMKMPPYKAYKIKVEKSVGAGERFPVGENEHSFVPMETSNDFDQRVFSL